MRGTWKRTWVGAACALGIGIGAVCIQGTPASGQAMPGSASSLPGKGTMTPVFGADGALSRVNVALKVFVDSPRSTTDFSEFKQQMAGASKTICDTTDGLVSIERVEFVNHPSEKKNADILWRGQDERAFSSGSFGEGSSMTCRNAQQSLSNVGRLTVAGLAGSHGHDAQLMAHELGHLLFGLEDYYTDQRGDDNPHFRSTGFTGRQSRALGGVSLFVNPRYGYAFSEASIPPDSALKLDGSVMYEGFGAPWWAQNNTLMQQASGQVCRRDVDHLAPSEVDPMWTDRECMTDADCAPYYTGGAPSARVPQPGDFQLCLTAGIPNNSEFSVSGNHDLDRFDRTRGTAAAEPARPDAYQFPGNQLVLAGFLYPSTDDQPNGFSPSGREVPTPEALGASGGSGHGDVPTLANQPGVEFQCFGPGQSSRPDTLCPGANALGHPDRLKFLAYCDSAVLAETSSCSPPLGTSTNPAVAGCGNGVVDFTTGTDALFEQCDSGAAAGPVFEDDGTTPLTCDRLYSPFRVNALGQTRDQASPGRRLTGGVVRCRPNCLFDLSECAMPFRAQGFTDSGGATTPPQTDGLVQLWEAHRQSVTTLLAEVYDKRGMVEKRPNVGTGALDALSPTPGASNGRGLNLGEMGPSNHGVFAFFQRLSRYHPQGWPVGTAPGDLTYNEVWGVTFAMDDAEFVSTPDQPRFAGVLQEVRRFTLEFAMDYRNNTSVLLKVNGHAFDPANSPLLYVGDNQGTPLSDTWGTQAATGPLKDRATAAGSIEPFQLRVDFKGLAVARRGDWDCTRPWAGRPPRPAAPVFGTPECTLLGRGTASVAQSPGLVQMYARNDLFTLPGSSQEFEAPQYPSLAYVNRNAPDPAAEAARLHAVSFNDTLKRYDSSEGTIRQALSGGAPAVQSDWERLQATLCDRFGIDLTTGNTRPPNEARLIKPDPPADCGNVSFNEEFIPDRTANFDVNTQVVFVMDKSGSMDASDSSTVTGALKRLDYAKYAARNFFSTIAKPTGGPRVGLSFYSTSTSLQFPQVSGPSCSRATEATDCGFAPYIGSCYNSGCKDPLKFAVLTSGGATEISQEQFNGGLRPSDDQLFGEDPIASGGTETGKALELAADVFDDRTGPPIPGQKDTRVVIHLSDGLANIPHTGTCLNPGKPDDGGDCTQVNCGGICSDAQTQVNSAIANHPEVQYWEFPVYYDGFSGAAQSRPTPARIFPGQRPAGDDMVPLFFAGAAELKGQSLARSHLRLPEMNGDTYNTPIDYTFNVEEGAKALTISVSDYDSTRQAFSVDVGRAILLSPSDRAYRFVPNFDANVAVTVDAAYAVLSLPSPQAGTWRVRESGGDPVEIRQPGYYVSAQVENSLPECTTFTKQRVYRDGETVVVVASSGYQRDIVEGATYTGTLLRPDKILVALNFVRNSITGEYEAVVQRSDLVGRGQYFVNVTCSVRDGATFIRGEDIDHSGTRPASNPTLPPAKAFERDSDTSFYLDSPKEAPLPGESTQDPAILTMRGLGPKFAPNVPFLGDADGDGIPNGAELPGDLDNDGIPNARDADANNNDLPDRVDPAVALIANAGPDQVVECQGHRRATITLDGSNSGPQGSATYLWNAGKVKLGSRTSAVTSGSFPLGSTQVSLTVSLGASSVEDAAVVTVRDTTPPALAVPPAIVVGACEQCLELGEAKAFDACGGEVTVVNDAPERFPVGDHVVTWRAVDRFGNETVKKQSVSVREKRHGEASKCWTSEHSSEDPHDEDEGVQGRAPTKQSEGHVAPRKKFVPLCSEEDEDEDGGGEHHDDDDSGEDPDEGEEEPSEHDDHGGEHHDHEDEDGPKACILDHRQRLPPRIKGN